MRSFLALFITGVHVCAQYTPSTEATALKTQLANLGVSFHTTSATNDANCPTEDGAVLAAGQNCLEVYEICCSSDGNVIGISINSGYESNSFSSLSGVTLPASLLALYIENNPNLVNLPTTLPGGLLHLRTSDCPEFTGAGVTLPTSLKLLNWGRNPKLNALPELPSSLTYLLVSGLIETLPDLPAGLLELNLFKISSSTLPALPASLTYLFAGSMPNLMAVGDTSHTSLTTLEANCNIGDGSPKMASLGALPSTLKSLQVNNCPITELPALPSSLTFLHAQSTKLTAMPAYPAGVTWNSLRLGGNSFWHCPMANDEWVTVSQPTGLTKILTTDLCVCPTGEYLPSDQTSKSIVERACSACQSSAGATCADATCGGSCDDGDDATYDMCSGTTCAGTACQASSGDTCADASCGGSCDDGEVATYNDMCSGTTCAGTTCQASPGPTCADASCGGSCDDGDDATYNDMCSGTTCAGTACQASAGATCADASCGGSCDDGDDATYNDVCSGITCAAGTACGTVANAANNASYTCTDGTDSRVSACASGFTKKEGAAGAADTCTNSSDSSASDSDSSDSDSSDSDSSDSDTDVDSAGQAVFAGLTILSLALM